jgi:hypothetical protein
LFVFFSQQTTTNPHTDARLDHQHPEKLVFVVGDGEEVDGLWVLLMVIFGLFVTFFLSFLLVAGVVGVFRFFCSFSTKWVFLEWVFSSIGGVGILAGPRRRVGRRSGSDLAGYTGPFSRIQ